MSDAIDRRLEEIFDAAQRHAVASEELDHEVGDLQDALKLAWEHLSPEGRKAVHAGVFKEVKEREAEEGQRWSVQG